MSGILSGEAIRCAVKAGTIEIDPFRQEQLNPVSYDLRLGRGVKVYKQVADWGGGSFEANDWSPIDAASDNPVLDLEMKADKPFQLNPGVGYLMHTEERIKTDRYVPVLDGKSSIGRLFISVHQCAGFGDPGFDGQYTLEVTALHPVLVYPGMLFAQIRFHEIAGEITKYAGNYVGEAARGPVASRSWRQFKKEIPSYSDEGLKGRLSWAQVQTCAGHTCPACKLLWPTFEQSKEHRYSGGEHLCWARAPLCLDAAWNFGQESKMTNEEKCLACDPDNTRDIGHTCRRTTS